MVQLTKIILKQTAHHTHDHVYCSIDDMITLNVHYPKVV